MKKYFKILAIATFALSFVAKSYSQNTSSQEQPKKTIEQRTAHLMDDMTKIATLTSDEVTKITPFVTEFQKQKDADQEAYKGNKEKLATARKTREDKLSAQVKSIVTPEQFTKLDDYWKNKQNNGNNNKPASNQ
jgi:hypothetical protein